MPGGGGVNAAAGAPVQLGLFADPGAGAVAPAAAPAASTAAAARQQLAELLESLLDPPASTPAARRAAGGTSRPRVAQVAAAATTSPAPALPAPLASGARGGWLARWSVPSASQASVVYIVARRGDGTMGCSCRGWIYHASRPQCRHIRAVLAGEAAKAAETAETAERPA
jgi:hypothetical protein